MDLNSLPYDIIHVILRFLSDNDKLSFISCSKSFRDLIYRLKFKDLVDYDDIRHLPYFNRFTKVRYTTHVPKIPKLIKEIHLGSESYASTSRIDAKRVIIEHISEKSIQEHAQQNPYSLLISLKHIQCREMIIKKVKTPCTILFPNLEKLVINLTSYEIALVLPDSLKSLHAHNVTINRFPSSLREINCYCLSIKSESTCQESLALQSLPKTLETFNVNEASEEIRSLLLSCYESLPLKSLTISAEMQLNLSTLEGLQELSLHGFDNLQLPCLPPRLKKLHIICAKYNRRLPKLPETLRELSFNPRKYYFSISKLPRLETLELLGKFFGKINFPESLRKLTLYGYHHKIDFSKLRNLKILELEYYKHDLTSLCHGLEKLRFTKFSTFNNDIVLPNTLKEIEFGLFFDREIILPESLEEIRFGDLFNQKIRFPSKLKKLFLGAYFNQEIELPESLEVLYLGDYFNQPIRKLPPRIKYLRVGWHFSWKLPLFPKTLKTFEDNRYSGYVSRLRMSA
jgi:hypothetical protein